MSKTLGYTKTLGSGDAAMQSSAQGFGCMGITAFYGKPMPDDDAVALIKHAFAGGITHFDTAELYTATLEDGSTKYNETVVGRAMNEIGLENVQVATKYFPQKHGDTMTPELVKAALTASLERLGMAFVDLYYVHRMHPSVSVEEQAAAMKSVLDAGLCKHVGLSEFAPHNIRAFHAICPVTTVQQEWSLVNRDLEAELVPCCRELGIGIVAYSPLCRSLLSGEVASAADLTGGDDDMRPSRYPRFAPANLAANAEKVTKVAALAAERGVVSAHTICRRLL